MNPFYVKHKCNWLKTTEHNRYSLSFHPGLLEGKLCCLTGAYLKRPLDDCTHCSLKPVLQHSNCTVQQYK